VIATGERPPDESRHPRLPHLGLVVVVSGGPSAVFEAAADDVAESMAGARRVLAGAGHFVQRHPGFAAMLTGFLQTHEPEPAVVIPIHLRVRVRCLTFAQSRLIQEVLGSMSELVEIRIPHGGSVENVEINEWLVSVGDVIDEGQPIADVSTDKADTELEAPASGKIVRFLVDEGSEIPVGTAVALLAATDASEEDVAALLTAYTPSSAE
jgi:biotin carboxyl carrier protein